MAKKASIGAGNVEIDLDGEACVLKPSLRAAQTISRQSGGIVGALQSVGRFDFDMITSVVALGLGLTGSDAKDVAEKVFATGLTELVEPVTRYLTILSNGGRPPEGTGGSEEEENPRNG